MLSGFYKAASGILNQQRTINTIGNNISNNQTVGYRAQRLVPTTYKQSFLTRLEDSKYVSIGKGDPAMYTKVVDTIFDESYLKDTDNPYDMAIGGDGFFNITGQDGRTYLTKNGNFNIDAEGYLVLEGIGRVQGRNGNLLVGGSDFSMTQHGLVYDNNGNYVDRILITMPENLEDMKRMPNGMFTVENADIAETAVVYQRKIETSNVDMNEEYTRLIEAQRLLQANATALKIVDQLNSKTATISSIT